MLTQQIAFRAATCANSANRSAFDFDLDRVADRFAKRVASELQKDSLNQHRLQIDLQRFFLLCVIYLTLILLQNFALAQCARAFENNFCDVRERFETVHKQIMEEKCVFCGGHSQAFMDGGEIISKDGVSSHQYCLVSR